MAMLWLSFLTQVLVFLTTVGSKHTYLIIDFDLNWSGNSNTDLTIHVLFLVGSIALERPLLVNVIEQLIRGQTSWKLVLFTIMTFA